MLHVRFSVWHRLCGIVGNSWVPCDWQVVSVEMLQVLHIKYLQNMEKTTSIYQLSTLTEKLREMYVGGGVGEAVKGGHGSG